MRSIPMVPPQLRRREMGPSLISKRTSFGSFQPHLSTLAAVSKLSQHH